MEKPALPTDQTLMEAVQKGDKNAFDLLYERYQPAIRSYLLRIVHSEAAADDLAQDVFLRVWTHAQQWSARGSFKAWMYRIATTQAFNTLRAARRHPEQPLSDPDSQRIEEDETFCFQAWIVDTAALEPDIALEMAERQRHLWQLIDQMPEEKRTVFNLVEQMELSIQNAAERLGIPEGTVKSRLHYARNWLSQNWESQGWLDQDW
jgi:RNA polymerase sigma-70 factor, ECF subfamily